MKLFKRILIIVGIIVVLLLVGTYIAIDMIARGAIDSAGTSIFGVPVNVNSVRLAVFTSDTSMQGLTIANPTGFKKTNFIEVEDAAIQASLTTMLSSNIDIPLVHITGFKVDLEQINQRMNASEIVANIEKATAPDSNAPASDPIDFNIEKLVIENIELTASGSIVNIAGGHLDAKIPRLELKDLGTKTNGDQLADHLISMMLNVVLQHIADHPIQGLSGAAVGSVAMALEKIPILGDTGVGYKIGNAIKGANSSINKGFQDVGKGLKGIGNGLGGVLGESPKEPEKGQDAGSEDKK